MSNLKEPLNKKHGDMESSHSPNYYSLTKEELM